jgi:quinol monooxygenase YgiN
MSNTVSWNIQLAVRDGQLDALRTLMGEMVESTKNESGAQAYEWFLSADGTTCHIDERYDDSAAVMVHLGGFGANFAERFLACVEPTGLNVYGEPNDEARAALDGLGATYLGTFGGFAR